MEREPPSLVLQVLLRYRREAHYCIDAHIHTRARAILVLFALKRMIIINSSTPVLPQQTKEESKLI
jgi:hypothetical protein